MGKFKNKLLDLSSVGIADIFASAISALFWFYIASFMSPEKYGELTFLISIAAVVSGIALFGSQHTILVLSGKKMDIHASIYLVTIVANIVGSVIIFIFSHLIYY